MLILKIGDSHFMLADEHPEMGALLALKRLGGAGVSLMIYHQDDADALICPSSLLRLALKNLAPSCRSVLW